MADTLSSQSWPHNERIIQKLKNEIETNLGGGMWNRLTGGFPPSPEMNDKELSDSTSRLVANFDQISPPELAYKLFSRVRHGLTRKDFQWAREKFLLYKNIDRFAQAVLNDSIDELRGCMETGGLFYGQPVTPAVYAYLLGIEDLFYGKRTGSILHATAIPFRTQDYLATNDIRKKRYYMCHCQFARESILSPAPVSKTMCHCSLGHNLMFWETALNTELQGTVTASALGGDVTCTFEIGLPEDIMKQYT